MEQHDANDSEINQLLITVRLSPRDYERLKTAFEQGKLEQFGIKDVYQFVKTEPAEPQQIGFAKAENKKRQPSKNSDSPRDLS
jgi:hypothetical protein